MQNFEKKKLEKTINYYPERIKEKSLNRIFTNNSPTGEIYFDSELKDKNILNEQYDYDENDYAKLNKINDINESVEYIENLNQHKHNNYELLGNPKLKIEKSLDHNFKIQRTNSSYETFNAIKKRVKFLEKIDFNEIKEYTESELDKNQNKNNQDINIVEFYDFSSKLSRSNSVIEKEKKKINSISKDKEKNKRIVIRNGNKIELENDSPLFESYKEIVNKSIESNKKQNEMKTTDKNIKYQHILDKLLDIDKEEKKKKKNKFANKLNNLQNNLNLSIEADEENYDPNLNRSENWLLKWSITKNNAPSNLVEIFNSNDIFKRGYLNEESLKKAINMACNMTNLKRSYLYNVLSLCGIDSANLKIFNIIISLALKINHLGNSLKKKIFFLLNSFNFMFF
jgi:hypothetical protein